MHFAVSKRTLKNKKKVKVTAMQRSHAFCVCTESLPKYLSSLTFMVHRKILSFWGSSWNVFHRHVTLLRAGFEHIWSMILLWFWKREAGRREKKNWRRKGDNWAGNCDPWSNAVLALLRLHAWRVHICVIATWGGVWWVWDWWDKKKKVFWWLMIAIKTHSVTSS